MLIPGAWHTAESYYILVPILESAGYQVTAINLISVGAEPPVQSLDPDIQHIRSTILPLIEQGKDVIVVMHSFGGIPGSSSLKGLSRSERFAQGLPGGVVGLVYLCAWVIPEGQSARDSGGDQSGKGGPQIVKVEGEYLYLVEPILACYHDCAEDVQRKAVKQLKHHSVATFDSRLTYAAYQHIPSTYLFCTNDQTIPIELQRKLIDQSGANFQTFECDAGHSPFLSQPELTARVIRRAAGESIEV